jgi:CheY-like chemotaxis protein
VAEKYKRIQDVEEKIHTVKLPYNAWKVFFLIDNEVSVPQISEYLEEDVSVVNEGLERLLKEGLVEGIAGEEEETQPEELVEEEADFDISMDTEDIEEESEPEVESEFFEEHLNSDLSDLDLEEPTETEAEPDIELSEEMPDFTDDLISVVEEEEEEKQPEDESLDELLSENLDIDEEVEMDLDTGQVEVEEPQIDIEGVEEEQEGDFDVSNLDVDFAEEVSEEPAPAPEKPEEKPKEEKTGAKTVLVIDDSIVIRKMVEIALEDENFSIATAVSGKDGLAMMDEKNPDLIILDLMLPDINGIDLLKTVKASKGIPVIMLSGKDSPQMVEKARAEGADAFLPKPFKDDELVEKIKELIG